MIAFGALDATRRLRLDVPGEVSIAGFDDIPMAGWDSFSLTTVRQPLTEMAREAARLLISRIEGSADDREPSRIVFPNHLVSRGTTGPAPSASPRDCLTREPRDCLTREPRDCLTREPRDCLTREPPARRTTPVIGVPGFEPGISRPQTERDTRLRYTPRSAAESSRDSLSPSQPPSQSSDLDHD